MVLTVYESPYPLPIGFLIGLLHLHKVRGRFGGEVWAGVYYGGGKF